jgi:hypothetical protein
MIGEPFEIFCERHGGNPLQLRRINPLTGNVTWLREWILPDGAMAANSDGLSYFTQEPHINAYRRLTASLKYWQLRLEYAHEDRQKCVNRSYEWDQRDWGPDPAREAGLLVRSPEAYQVRASRLALIIAKCQVEIPKVQGEIDETPEGKAALQAKQRAIYDPYVMQGIL